LFLPYFKSLVRREKYGDMSSLQFEGAVGGEQSRLVEEWLGGFAGTADIIISGAPRRASRQHEI